MKYFAAFILLSILSTVGSQSYAQTAVIAQGTISAPADQSNIILEIADDTRLVGMLSIDISVSSNPGGKGVSVFYVDRSDTDQLVGTFSTGKPRAVIMQASKVKKIRIQSSGIPPQDTHTSAYRIVLFLKFPKSN